MSGKKWLTIWLTPLLLFIIIPILLITQTDIPWRFSNSISYDAKLNFIKNTNILKNSNTLIIGSSMALNNVDGIGLEERSNSIEKVANLSSWGLQTSEVLQLLKLINLKEVEYIIYPTQYIDFQLYTLKNIDEEEVKAYINNEIVVLQYLNTLKSLPDNIDSYLDYDEIFNNKNKYSNLSFDRTGSVMLEFSKKYIDKSRWNSTKKDGFELSQKCFNNLIEINNIARSNNIELLVVTTPFRRSVLKENSNLEKIFNQYVQQLKELSTQHSFQYLDTHKTLNLDDTYFVDKEHLNKEGATSVSNEIIKKIGH